MKRLQTGFTLIEVVVVIGILAVLATIVAIEYREIQPRARDTERQNDVKTLASAFERYYMKTGQYPRYWDLTDRRAVARGLNIPDGALIAPGSPEDVEDNGSGPAPQTSIKPLTWATAPDIHRYYYWTPGEDSYPDFTDLDRNTFILLYSREQSGGTPFVGVCGRGKNINTSKQTLNSSSLLASKGINASNCSNF